MFEKLIYRVEGISSADLEGHMSSSRSDALETTDSVSTSSNSNSDHSRSSRHRFWRRLKEVFWYLTVLCVVAIAVTYVAYPSITKQNIIIRIIEACIVFVLSFFPAWLFARFMTLRGPALWTEYRINLHRLGVDRREHLPEPPKDSEYYQPWLDAVHKAHLDTKQKDRHNIYRQKFDAYYGRKFTACIEDGPYLEALLPILLYTVTVAIGWATILHGQTLEEFRKELFKLSSAGDVLKFGFAGAYLFNVQMLLRRYFQSDLKASAYASAFTRVVTVLIIVTVLHQLPIFEDDRSHSGEAIVAFIVGFFPLVGLQALQRTASVILGLAVKSLKSEYPLSDLDGLNIWYEARLLEEGIEDQQELVTANIVEIILSTRVPVGRLVDWLDQAHLYLHLPKSDEKQRQPSSTTGAEPHQMRDALRQTGIRRASDLLIAFGKYQAVGQSTFLDLDKKMCQDDNGNCTLAAWIAERAGLDNKEVVFALVNVLAADTGLTPILNWRHWGAKRLSELENGMACDEPQYGRSIVRAAVVSGLMSAAEKAEEPLIGLAGFLIDGVDNMSYLPDVLVMRLGEGKGSKPDIFKSKLDSGQIELAIDILTTEGNLTQRRNPMYEKSKA